MKNTLILIIALFISNVAFSGSKRIIQRDSSYHAFFNANRALREYGFEVTSSKKNKWILLENEVAGNCYQVLITFKGRKGILIESFGFFKTKRAWTHFPTIERALDGIEIIVRNELETPNLPDRIKNLELMNTPFWSAPKENIK